MKNAKAIQILTAPVAMTESAGDNYRSLIDTASEAIPGFKELLSPSAHRHPAFADVLLAIVADHYMENMPSALYTTKPRYTAEQLDLLPIPGMKERMEKVQDIVYPSLGEFMAGQERLTDAGNIAQARTVMAGLPMVVAILSMIGNDKTVKPDCVKAVHHALKSQRDRKLAASIARSERDVTGLANAPEVLRLVSLFDELAYDGESRISRTEFERRLADARPGYIPAEEFAAVIQEQLQRHYDKPNNVTGHKALGRLVNAYAFVGEAQMQYAQREHDQFDREDTGAQDIYKVAVTQFEKFAQALGASLEQRGR